MRYILLLLSIFLLSACAPSYRGSDALYENVEAMDIETNSMPAMRGKRMPAKLLIAQEAREAMDMGAPAESESAAAGRMVNYTGNISLQSSEPEAAIDSAVKRAKEKGGFVSERRNGFALLQIPAAEFRSFFNYVLTLGSVASKNIFANDITDAFTDNAERLRIAESTLARLQELLSHAKSEQEKIALLKEIQRVSEQIEQAKLREKELLRMAAFSSISLSAWNSAPAPRPLSANIKAFRWFQYLGKYEKPLKLDVPQNFIETDNTSSLWRAASALNTELYAHKRKNEPQGSADFWASAMLSYFKNECKAELKTEDNFSLIRLQGFGAEQQIIYIAILKSSDKKTLKIAKAIFRNAEAEKKDSEAILEMLRRAK